MTHPNLRHTPSDRPKHTITVFFFSGTDVCSENRLNDKPVRFTEIVFAKKPVMFINQIRQYRVTTRCVLTRGGRRWEFYSNFSVNNEFEPLKYYRNTSSAATGSEHKGERRVLNITSSAILYAHETRMGQTSHQIDANGGRFA